MPKVGEIYRDRPYEGYKLKVTKVTKYTVYFKWIVNPTRYSRNESQGLSEWELDEENWELDKQSILKQILDKTEIPQLKPIKISYEPKKKSV